MLDLTEFGNSVPVTMAGILHKDFQDKRVTGAVYYTKYQDRGYVVAGLNQEDFANIGITELDQMSELHSMDGRGSITLIRFENNKDVLGFIMSSEVYRIIESTPALQALMDYEWGIYKIEDPQSEAPMTGDLKPLRYGDGAEVRIHYKDLTRWFELVNEYGMAQVLGERENWWALAKELEEPEEESEDDGFMVGGGSVDLDEDFGDEGDFSMGEDDLVYEGEFVDGPRTPKNLDPKDAYREQAQEDMVYSKDSAIDSQEPTGGLKGIETSGEIYVEGDLSHNIDTLVEEDDGLPEAGDEVFEEEDELVFDDSHPFDEEDYFETDGEEDFDDDLGAVGIEEAEEMEALFEFDEWPEENEVDEFGPESSDEDLEDNSEGLEEDEDDLEEKDEGLEEEVAEMSSEDNFVEEEESRSVEDFVDVVDEDLGDSVSGEIPIEGDLFAESEEEGKGDDGIVSEKETVDVSVLLDSGDNMELETRRTLTEDEKFEQMLAEDELAEKEAARLAAEEEEAEVQAVLEAEEEVGVEEVVEVEAPGDNQADSTPPTEPEIVYESEGIYPYSASMILGELLEKETTPEEREEIAGIFLNDLSAVEDVISSIAIDDQQLDELSESARKRIVSTINRERNFLAQDILEVLLVSGHEAFVKTTPDTEGVDEDIQTQFDDEVVAYSKEAEGKIESEKEAFKEEVERKYNEAFDAWWEDLSADPKAYFDDLNKEKDLIQPVEAFEEELTEKVNNTIADRVEALNDKVVQRQHQAHREFLLDNLRVWRRVASTSEQMIEASVTSAVLTETVSSLQEQIGNRSLEPVETIAPQASKGPSQEEAERASAVLGGQEEEEVYEEPVVEVEEELIAKEAPVEETEDEEIARLKEEIKEVPAQESSTGDLDLKRGAPGLTPAEAAAQKAKEEEVPADVFGSEDTAFGANDEVFGGTGEDSDLFGGAGGEIFGAQPKQEEPQAPANDIFSQLANQPVSGQMPAENPNAFGGGGSEPASGDVFAGMVGGATGLEVPADAGQSNLPVPSQEVPAEEDTEEKPKKKGFFGRLGLGKKK